MAARVVKGRQVDYRKHDNLNLLLGLIDESVLKRFINVNPIPFTLSCICLIQRSDFK